MVFSAHSASYGPDHTRYTTSDAAPKSGCSYSYCEEFFQQLWTWKGYLTIWIQKYLFPHALSAREKAMTARTSKLRGSILITLLLLFHLLPYSQQSPTRALSPEISFSRLSLLERYLIRFYCSLQSPFHCSLPVAGTPRPRDAFINSCNASSQIEWMLLYSAPNCRPIIASVVGGYCQLFPKSHCASRLP